MNRVCTILCAALLFAMLSGCSGEHTAQHSNAHVSDTQHPIANDITSDNAPDGTDADSSSAVISITSTSKQTTNAPSQDQTTTVTTHKGNGKPSVTSTSKKKEQSTTKTTKQSSTPQNTQPSRSVTTKTAATAKPDNGTPNVQGTFHTDMAQAVLVSINAARKEAGLNELKMDNGNMMNAAKIRAKEITVHWAHERPDGAKWDTVFNEEGAKYNARGENLADGYKTADSVFAGWMGSEGHKANIMEERFTHVSIVCFEVNGHFYWVQLFGATITR